MVINQVKIYFFCELLFDNANFQASQKIQMLNNQSTQAISEAKRGLNE
jgi:hypothetical protein